MRSTTHRRRALGALLAAAVAALLALPAAASAAGSATAVCRGGDSTCLATFSLAGGASNKRLTVELPGTNLKLVAHVVTPHWVAGAYSLSRGRYSLGGSVYTTTLNAVQSIPRGAKLRLEFAVEQTSLNCGGIHTGVGYLTIARVGATQARGAFGCPQAADVADTFLLRFRAGESVRAFSVNDVRYACKLVPRIPQNMQCTGGGTIVRFAAPTGR
ncbi:MAG TPA: hypothetical protein VK506_00665 [Conexibacter sp.]|nr:hypothetical protein [Conexibacter sp.]